MKRLTAIFIVALLLAGQTTGAHAAIVATGNVDPADPSTWTDSTDAKIGYIPENDTNGGIGSVTVTDGNDILSHRGYLGYDDSFGTVTISGEGSTWTNSGNLYVGYSGSGTLDIMDGGTVSVEEVTYIAYHTNAIGVINFGENGGGTLATQTLCYASPSQLTGTGTIYTNGLIGDLDLVFDSTHGASQTIYLNQENQNISLNLDMTDPNSAGGLGIGYQANGTLTINDGVTVYSNYGNVGCSSGSSGTVTVSGEGSTWTNTSILTIGSFGNGILNITDSGAVSNTNGYIGAGSFSSSGEVTVDGQGSTWSNSSDLIIGLTGNGTLNITGGGSVDNANSYIGYSYNSPGKVTVNGEGSTWNNSGDLYVGQSTNGTLNITGGGVVNNNNGFICRHSGSSGEVTVDGEGSTWNNRGNLRIGYIGNGTLNILNSSTVSVGGATLIAHSSNATGTINFGESGGGTLETQTLYYTSPSQLTGTGIINTNGLISDFDLVFDSTNETSITMILDSQENQNVTLNLNMADSGNPGDLGLGHWENGSLAVSDGVTIYSNRSYLGYSLYSSGTATISGEGSTWVNSSYLYVGQTGTGTINITDGGLVVTRMLTIDNDDGNGDSFINISDDGMLAIAGEVDDSLDVFLGLVQGTDAIRWWDPEASGWNSLNTAIEGEDYTLEYLTDGDLAGYTLLTVTAIEPVKGDANCDGRVDGSDVTILASNWQHGCGRPANWSMGDFNGDCQVDGSDLTILAMNWQYGVTSSANAVPEPATVVSLLMLFVVGLVCIIKKQR